MASASSSPFELKIGLNVLEHLGINLYSTLPAVLSEVVANAWDADATKVTIDWDTDAGKIIIGDNGQGMSQEDLNKHFLLVGYQRRVHQPGPTPKGRSPMGRKGIGKLSLFSIAETIDVASSSGGPWNAFRMHLPDILELINNNATTNNDSEIATYRPPVQDIDTLPEGTGTIISLSNLRHRPSIATTKFLRQRIARRFSVISDSHDFTVIVNGEPVTTADRGYQQHIQYLWQYGDDSMSNDRLATLDRQAESRPFTIDSAEESDIDLEIRGWIGTVRSSGMLKSADEENLNRIAIFIRGKLAQQDILGDFAERGVYAGYVVGELDISGLDVYDGGETKHDDDIATSNRQQLVDDDPRYTALRKFIKTELQHIGKRWNEWRLEEGAKNALEIPEVKEWHEALPPAEAKMARKWLGRINRIPVEEIDERKQLIKHTVLAFEAFRNQQLLEELDVLPDQSLPEVLRIAGRLDQVEMSYYTAIVKQRLAVIQKMHEYARTNPIERAVQEYLFKHLWLLDPSWERADHAAVMEERVAAIIEDTDNKLDEQILAGRLDIRYRKTAGTHVVIELKRPGRRISVMTTIAEQIRKYRLGIIQELDRQNRLNEPVEIILLVGEKPEEWAYPQDRESAMASLEAQNARIVFYDQLLQDAYDQYKDYLEAHATIDQLGKLISAIENFGASDSIESP